MTPEGLKVLLSFTIARGSVKGIIRTILLLRKQDDAIRLDCVPLLKEMHAVLENYYRKHGQPLQVGGTVSTWWIVLKQLSLVLQFRGVYSNIYTGNMLASS